MQGREVASSPGQVEVHVVVAAATQAESSRRGVKFSHFAARLAVVNGGWWRGCDSAYPGGDPGRRPGSSSQGNVTSCAAATRNAATSS